MALIGKIGGGMGQQGEQQAGQFPDQNEARCAAQRQLDSFVRQEKTFVLGVQGTIPDVDDFKNGLEGMHQPPVPEQFQTMDALAANVHVNP